MKIDIDSDEIKRINEAAERAAEMTMEAVHTDAVQRTVIPRDTGALQNENTSVETIDGRPAVVSDTPYARRLYYHPEYKFSRTRNPNAQAGWFDDYISGSRAQFVVEAFEKMMKREL